jgi:polyisoprenoid-binding protein YceI
VADPVHSGVNFVARHLVGSKVRGKFNEFTATLTIADPLESSFLEAVAQVASIDTGHEQRDAHLKSPDFFDAENHPTILLVSTGMTRVSETEWKMNSNMTVRGVTKPVAWDLEYLGSGLSMEPGSTVAAFSATAEIDRRDFEVSFNHTLADSSLVVGNKVRLELDVEARLQSGETSV